MSETTHHSAWRPGRRGPIPGRGMWASGGGGTFSSSRRPALADALPQFQLAHPAQAGVPVPAPVPAPKGEQKPHLLEDVLLIEEGAVLQRENTHTVPYKSLAPFSLGTSQKAHSCPAPRPAPPSPCSAPGQEPLLPEASDLAGDCVHGVGEGIYGQMERSEVDATADCPEGQGLQGLSCRGVPSTLRAGWLWGLCVRVAVRRDGEPQVHRLGNTCIYPASEASRTDEVTQGGPGG